MKSFLTKKAHNLFMSLRDPDEEYSELVPEGAGKVKKFLKKARFYVVILIIGIIIGAYLQYAYFNPLVYQLSTSPCSDCMATKDLLNKENTCLYDLLPNPALASSECRQTQAVVDTTPVENSNPLPDNNQPLITDNNSPPGLGDANEPDKGF
jgi:hypothetical protein